MKKAFIKYLFPLVVLLVSGFVNLYADSQENIHAEDACYLQTLENQHSSETLHSLELGLEKRYCTEIDVEEQEEREEEVASHGFSIKYGKSFAAHEFAASWGQLFLESNTNYGLSRPKSASSIKKHVRFQVFRI
ncbi:MAG: hypothetical protein Tsb004_12130 [Allomuricauda sp.]